MLLQKNEAFDRLCIIEGREPDDIQFDVLLEGLNCGVITEDCIGKTILKCLETEENGNIEMFFRVVKIRESIKYLIQCVIIE